MTNTIKSLKNLLQRSTNSTSFIPEIDGLRFYSIIPVVLFHLNTVFSRHIGLDNLGLPLLGGRDNIWSPAWYLVRFDLGVKVFFSISGMVLALPFLRHYLLGAPIISLKDYFYRRLTRLEPPFILSLLLFLTVHIIVLGETSSSILPHFWAGLTYTHVLIYGEPNPINPVTWSLETEAQFYILIPFFFSLLFLIRRNLYIFSILTLSFTASVYLKGYFVENNISQLYNSIFAYFSNFLIGILLAWLYITRKSFLSQKNYIWDLIGLLSLFGQFYFYKPQNYWLNNVLFNTSILFFMISAFKGSNFNWFFTRPIVFLIGGMCYSIYLLHYAFFHLWIQFTGDLLVGENYGTNLLIQVILGLPAALFLSGIFFILIERPCMNRLWPQKLKRFIFPNSN